MPTPLPSPSAIETTTLVETLGGWTGAISDIATAAAIAVGGWWTYVKFIRERTEWPRATLEHRISHLDVDGQRRVLRVVEKISNTGTVLLETSERTTLVQKLIPSDSGIIDRLRDENQQEADWEVLARHVLDDPDKQASIEPGESDHFEHDFVIDSDIDVVQVYSYFKNVKHEEREMGWPMTTIYDMRSDEPVKSKLENVTTKEE